MTDKDQDPNAEAPAMPPSSEQETVVGPIGGGEKTSSGHTSRTYATRRINMATSGFGALVGKTWGDVEIGEILGRGGMGAVFRGRQIGLNRAVAVKVLPPDQAEETNSRERFLREARAIALVSSPNIVQVFHAGTQDGWSYYVMELIEGADLSHRMKNGWRPTVNESRGLILQAARGLATAARNGIVHRDIKPGNLLLSPDGTLKIADFGLVRHRSEGNLTATGQVMGTTSYMSPEQGLGRVCDERSDLYSLGIVFYELLSGTLPFVGENPSAVIYQHIHEPPPSLRARAPLVDADTESVVMQLMAKDPDLRYASADALISDLEAIESGRHPATIKIVRRSRKRRVFVSAAISVAIAIGAAATWYMEKHKPMVVVPEVAATNQAPIEARVVSVVGPTQPTVPISRDVRGDFVDLELAKGFGLRLRHTPTGDFYVGSPASEPGRGKDEASCRVLFSTGFWMTESEVTQQAWSSVMGTIPTQEFPRDDLPVTNVDRKQVGVFCERLTKRFPGLQARLPTEAEWEFAARAGSDDRFGGAKTASGVAGWYAGANNTGRRPHPPKSFPPNVWGFYDMLGNVAEWTADTYAPRTETMMSDPRPVTGDGPGVIKGGSWSDELENCRVARRENATNASSRIGFRFVVLRLPNLPPTH